MQVPQRAMGIAAPAQETAIALPSQYAAPPPCSVCGVVFGHTHSCAVPRGGGAPTNGSPTGASSVPLQAGRKVVSTRTPGVTFHDSALHCVRVLRVYSDAGQL